MTKNEENLRYFDKILTSCSIANESKIMSCNSLSMAMNYKEEDGKSKLHQNHLQHHQHQVKESGSNLDHITVNLTSSSNDNKSELDGMPLLKQRLGFLLEHKQFTDVIFLVGPAKETVEAHLLIVASGSGVFQQLLADRQKILSNNNEKLVLREREFDPFPFKVFINGLYTNEIPKNLSLTSALKVLHVAKKYKSRFMVDQILNHISESVTVANVFQCLQMSLECLEMTQVIPACLKVIEERTAEVLETNLGSLDVKKFLKILQRETLSVDEASLFQALVRWGAVQAKRLGLKTTGRNKRTVLEPLLKYIRFPTMTLAQMEEIVIPSRILDQREISSIITLIKGSGELPDKFYPIPYKSKARKLFSRESQDLLHSSESENNLRTKLLWTPTSNDKSRQNTATNNTENSSGDFISNLISFGQKLTVVAGNRANTGGILNNNKMTSNQKNSSIAPSSRKIIRPRRISAVSTTSTTTLK